MQADSPERLEVGPETYSIAYSAQGPATSSINPRLVLLPPRGRPILIRKKGSQQGNRASRTSLGLMGATCSQLIIPNAIARTPNTIVDLIAG